MVKSYKHNDNTVPYVTEYVADTDDDVADLPTETVAPGSTCIIAASSSVYILNASHEWVKIG